MTRPIYALETCGGKYRGPSHFALNRCGMPVPVSYHEGVFYCGAILRSEKFNDEMRIRQQLSTTVYIILDHFIQQVTKRITVDE